MNSSDKNSFTDAELQALSLWDAPEVSDGDADGRSESIVLDENLGPVLTVDEIEAMQNQAYTEAFARGEEEGRKSGYQQGYEEGSQQGYEENRQLLQSQAEQLLNIMESLHEPLARLDEEVERELVALAMAVAAQLVRRELKSDPGQVIAAVREAVAILPLSAQKITLHLHPEDADLVRSALALDEVSPPWQIIEEPLITRGGCKVDSELSHIDATVENRLAAVVANVLGGERQEDQQ